MYRKTILENGIRIITETMESVRSVSVGVMIDAGPRDETPQQAGLAHLAEHAMFQGTSSRNAMQIARLIDSAGGQTGAFTTRDYTCYTATVLDDYCTYALDLLGDILLNSIFPPEALEREKRAILCETDAARDIPDERVHDLLKAFVWSGHHLGRSVAGHPDSVRTLTREDVIYFVHEHYLSDRLIIAAAGQVRHEDFVAQVRDAFWRMLPPVKEDETSDRQHKKLAFQDGVVMEHIPVSQTYFSVGIRTHPYTYPGRYGLYVLNNILGSGISSRLFRRMREERGLVYNISSEYHAYRDDGILMIEGSTTPEYLMQVLGLTLVELWKLISGEEPADEEELWKAKMNLRGQFMIASENTNTRMSRLATQEFYFGRHIPAEEILTKIDAVDIQTFQHLANDGLTDALTRGAVAVVGPEGNPDHYSISSIKDLLKFEI